MATVGLEAAARRYDRRRAESMATQREALTHLQRDPLAAVGVTFVAGVIIGSLIGWFGHQPAPRPRADAAGIVRA